VRFIYALGIFIPVAVALEIGHASPTLIFFAAALGVVPTAAVMGRATEEIAHRSGPGIGGILNVTFGNAPELIIAFFALQKGLHEVVKASIAGSILGNILLVMGAAMLVGGIKAPADSKSGLKEQRFEAQAAHAQAGMLLLTVIALIMPVMYELMSGGPLPKAGENRINFGSTVENLSLAVAIILVIIYAFGQLFALKTHRNLFNPYVGEEESEQTEETWTMRKALIALAISGVLVGLMSEILVGSIEEASHDVGLSEFFVGVIVVAIVGNAAEHWVAVLVAAKQKMDLAVNIAMGSSAQIAMFVAPVLVIISFFVGPNPMALVFNGYEITAMIGAVLIAQFVTIEGRSNWFEGIQLLGLYTILGFVFYFA
jgi:Ca2+:H+ antiporter